MPSRCKEPADFKAAESEACYYLSVAVSGCVGVSVCRCVGVSVCQCVGVYYDTH